MPGAGTHTTIIQHLAQENATFRKFLGDPALNSNPATYGIDEALRSRYAILGAMGPDIFYAMLDYGADMQVFEDAVIKVAGTLECVGEVSGEINRYITAAADKVTGGVWSALQKTSTTLVAVLEGSVLDAILSNTNLWSIFLPLRQVDDYRQNWYWADFLHYVKTGCFARKLLENSMTYTDDQRTTAFLQAYSLGYVTHYVADTVGHAYVNRIVESPWRNCWQRHHLVENFIDAYVWDKWHSPSQAQKKPGDEDPLHVILDRSVADDPARKVGDGAPLHSSRLNDLCNIGSTGWDTSLDAAISSVCDAIQKGMSDLNMVTPSALQAPDDPAFVTWANFIADSIWETYPPTPLPAPLQEHPVKLASAKLSSCPDPGGYPSADDIMGAYGVYRIVLSLATEDKVEAPVFPDIVGDVLGAIQQIWNEIKKDLGNIPAPPSIPTSGSFSLSALWDDIKKYAQWLGDVAVAVIKTLGDIIAGTFKVIGISAADLVKLGLFYLNSAIFSLYKAVRMPLVLSAYAVPYTEDLMAKVGQLDCETLWKVVAEEGTIFPVEPVVSERDFFTDPFHTLSPYKPYLRPSTLAPGNVEMPTTTPPHALLAWRNPDDMLESPLGPNSMLSASGPAPKTTVPLLDKAGNLVASLETFDGSQRYFGGIFANCEAALNAVIPWVSGGNLAPGTAFPDYNLDSDRGYAWPSWDVDYNTPNPANPYPWNGCDPFPADTAARVAAKGPGSIDWGSPSLAALRPFIINVDPFGKPRDGKAWVNATALSKPAVCGFQNIPFAFITINPDDALDPCNPVINTDTPPGRLPFDYFLPSPDLLQNDPDDKVFTEAQLQQMDNLLTKVQPQNQERDENDGRLADFFRGLAQAADPLTTLATAVVVANQVPGAAPVQFIQKLDVAQEASKALAQLAVTGRRSYTAFAAMEPADGDVVAAVQNKFPNANLALPVLQSTARDVLDHAYTAAWAIRSNDPGWRALRHSLGWIATSGIDDTPHRPVNVPTGPYPQFDISFEVAKPDGKMFEVTTRYMVASAGAFIGPNDSTQSSFTNPDPNVITTPYSPPISVSPAPRAVPADVPSIPFGDEIIVYIHGGGSRAEEAVGLANWLMIEGSKAGRSYTVVSFDLPNSAYGVPFDIPEAVGSWDASEGRVFQFELDYIIAFIEALDSKFGNVKGRIAAVMGGSLGGNTSLRLSGMADAHPYLKTIVSWSVTAAASSLFMGLLKVAPIAEYFGGIRSAATSAELFGDHTTESSYIRSMYLNPLSQGKVWPVPYIPPQPIMWFRGADDWQDCKRSDVAQSRFDRYEIYSMFERHWTSAIDLEQIYFSFQEDCLYRKIASSPLSRLMLCAGDADNFNPNAIYNSTISLARLIRHLVKGKAEFWANTGHSFHSERPNLFAKEIVYFLTHPDASDSPNGVSTSPSSAPYSRTDQ